MHIPTKMWMELSYLDFNDKLEWCMRERIGDGFETLTILIQLGDHKLLKPQYLNTLIIAFMLNEEKHDQFYLYI